MSCRIPVLGNTANLPVINMIKTTKVTRKLSFSAKITKSIIPNLS